MGFSPFKLKAIVLTPKAGGIVLNCARWYDWLEPKIGGASGLSRCENRVKGRVYQMRSGYAISGRWLFRIIFKKAGRSCIVLKEGPF